MSMIEAALKRSGEAIADPDSEEKYEAAQNAVLDALQATQDDAFDAQRLELAFSTSAELSATYFDVTNAYINSAPSYEPEDSWVKVSGLSFYFNSTKAYAPYMQVPEAVRKALAHALTAHASSAFDFKGRVEISDFGLIITSSGCDLPGFASLLALEESVSRTKQAMRVPMIQSEEAVNLVLGCRIVLPFDEAPGIKDWEQFFETIAVDVEIGNGFDFDLLLPDLSIEPGKFRRGDDLTQIVGDILLEDTEFDAMVIDFNDREAVNPIIEFVLTDSTFLVPELTGTEISVRFKDGNKMLNEQELIDTNAPAFLLGYMQNLIQTVLRPGCPVSVVDLRGNN